MTRSYWQKAHIDLYSKADWAKRPSIFSQECIKFFPKTGTLLEIGTGQGNDAGYFQSQGYEVTATDYSEEALESAKLKFKDVQFFNVDTAEGLPFGEGSFDVVYSHMALHYFDAKTTKRVIEDIHRILKIDGVFATILNTHNDPEKEDYNYHEIEPGYYQDPRGIKKRYFSTKTLTKFVEGLFETSVLDEKGSTYKDSESYLVRFVGRKL